MKKVLCGLVIAIMMTSSGYADLSTDKCNYLKNRAESSVRGGMGYNKSIMFEEERQAREGIVDNSIYRTINESELNAIKKAHYFAVTWSALCD